MFIDEFENIVTRLNSTQSSNKMIPTDDDRNYFIARLFINEKSADLLMKTQKGTEKNRQY